LLPEPAYRVTLPGVELQRSLNGALAGAAGAVVWAAQQPLDKRVFSSGYDDVELLGKFVARGEGWLPAGLVLHVQNGAAFGAVYALARPFLPGPPLVSAILASMAEQVGFWPLGRLVDRHHPRRGELTPLTGNRRAFAQATWRHLLFALVMGELERRLNAPDEFEPPQVPVSSNGHGNIEAAVGAA
jgi:hypothetical protein